MPEQFKSKILRHVRHRSYEPTTVEQLAEELGVDDSDREAFRETVEELADAGHVVIGSSETVALPPMGEHVEGRFKLHERGFGFLMPEVPNAHGDLFVPAGQTADALTGDLVRAEVVRRKGRRGPEGRSPYTGRIVEVLERRHTRFPGTLERRGKKWYVVPDGKVLAEPIVVRDPGAKHAREGQKVVAELTLWPQGGQLPEGVITEVLGETGEPDVETLAIMRGFGLPEEFPEEVMAEARRQVERYQRDHEKMAAGRLDLRDTFIVTIDPPDAQDYDDAISIEPVEDGVELGVHIADVATFVEPDTALDREAYERGNSAYLPRRVIPMLPEVISNGICSLQPEVDRLARSVFITYSERGKPLRSRFARSVIRSNHRLTYLEAQALIDGDPKEAAKHAKGEAPYSDRLTKKLRELDQLAKRIRKRRHRAGMIVLDLPEVELVFDESGRVVDAEPEDDAFTHKLIESFMVEANEAVARIFADLAVPLIRRIHPDPGPHDTSELQHFARVAGYNIPQNPTRKELQKLLDQVRGTPSAKAVHLAVLRTLTKAEYAPDLIGHFALASEHYTHYTSPIRRYPDLTVHRALDALTDELGERTEIPKRAKQRKILGNRLRNDERVASYDKLRQVGRHCSNTERNAEQGERELRNLLVLQLLEQHIGEEYEGTVTGCTSFGAFIQIDKYLVDGMVRTADLPGAPGDQWKLNSQTGALVAERSGRTLQIGDTCKVRINQVDLVRRELDVLIVEDETNPAKKPKGGRGGQGKGKSQGDGKGANQDPRKGQGRGKGKGQSAGQGKVKGKGGSSDGGRKETPHPMKKKKKNKRSSGRGSGKRR